LHAELDERMHDLKNELEGYNTGDSDEINKNKALDALKRMENWNLFRDIKVVRPALKSRFQNQHIFYNKAGHLKLTLTNF
jgi:hypothetical protein